MPLITVVTVCKNSEEYIEQCITSVLKQSYHDYEYVVIDGGSEDSTVSLIEGYCEDIAYWHSREDRGLAHAFNLGLENSTGDWLIYLNSDDYFSNADVLRNIEPYLHEHKNADVVYGQVNVVSRSIQPVVIGGPYGGGFNWNEFARKDTIPHQSAFTSRSYFRKVGSFSESFRVAVDYEHYLRGGALLNAFYAPVMVANMRDGGLSKVNVYYSMADWARAQAQSGARNSVVAWFGFMLNAIRLTLSGIYKKVRAMLDINTN